MFASRSKLHDARVEAPAFPSGAGHAGVPASRSDTTAGRHARAAALEGVWDAFELDAFGGPEAETEPEPGDFASVPEELAWEGGWQ